MSDFILKTQQQIRDEEVDDILNTYETAVARGPGDDLYDQAVADSLLLEEAYGALAKASDEAFPQTCSFENLKKMASPLIGDPLPATAAQLPILITGTAGSTWATTDLLTCLETGVEYAPLADGTMPGAGSTTITVEATTGGANTALAIDAQLRWLAEPAGINPLATVNGEADGGTAAEKQDEYLARFLDVKANPDAGGRKADFKRWAKSVTGVGRATCFPRRRGLGTVDVAVLDREGDPVSDEVLSDAQDNQDEERPDCLKDNQVVKPTIVDVDLTIEVYLADGYEFSDAPAESAVLANSTATSIKVADVTGYAADQWVALRDLRQARKILSVDAASNTINVYNAFLDEYGNPTPPETNDKVWPGCPTYDEMVGAIEAYFDELSIGGDYYHAKALGRLTTRYEVLNARQVSPDGDVEAIVDPTLIQALQLGDLKIQAWSL